MKEWALIHPYLAFAGGIMCMTFVSQILSQLIELFKKQPVQFELKLPTMDQDEINRQLSNSTGQIIN